MSIPKLSPSELQRALQCAAKCDAQLASEDWLRTFWYEENWSDGITMAKYDNGGGDHVIALFSPDGKVLIKGFDHESDVSPHAREEYEIWPGMYDDAPADLLGLLEGEEMECEDVTFCCWSEDGKTWKTGNAQIPEDTDDGSKWLLAVVQMNAEEFIEWAKSYYQDDFDKLGESGVFAEFKTESAGVA